MNCRIKLNYGPTVAPRNDRKRPTRVIYKPPRFAFFFVDMSKKHFDVSGLFSKLRACDVSVAASG